MSALGLIMAGAFFVGTTVFVGSSLNANAANATALRIAQANTPEDADAAANEPAEQPPADPSAAEDAGGQEAPAEEVAVEEEDTCCEKGDKTPPFKLIAEWPPGELNNPYDWKALKEEHQDDPDYLAKQYRLPGCNECHGGGGGGGICPPLGQGVWFWGNTDDVLFRLIALGSDELEKQGFSRYQYGTVKAPMPEMGQVIKTSDHLWKIIAFIRSINPPGTNPPEKVIPGKYTQPVEVPQAE
ncbi:MAG: hypothetical protein AAF405_01960 [Pseudomonadota bacterium]